MAATRYIGSAKFSITLNDRNDTYKVAITAGKYRSTQYVGVPAARRGYGVDNPRAFDEAASAAASFEVNDRGPTADAIESGYATDGMGWNVRRTAARKNAPRGRATRKTTRANAGRKPAPADPIAARELVLYAWNDGDLYRQRRQPIEENLRHKVAARKYSAALAPKLWRYFADAAAVKYQREFGSGSVIFSPATRQMAAEEMARTWEDENADLLAEAAANPTRPAKRTSARKNAPRARKPSRSTKRPARSNRPRKATTGRRSTARKNAPRRKATTRRAR